MTNILESGVINYNISDHLPTSLIKKKLRKIRKENVEGPSYLHFDKDVFSRLFRSMDWTRFDIDTETSILWDIFCLNVTNALDVIWLIRQLITNLNG